MAFRTACGGFASPREYVEEATRLDRRRDYYGGRVSEASEDHAAITVQLRWPEASALVTRQLFGSGAVTAVEIETSTGTAPRKNSGESANETYREFVVKQCGLPSFDQFVFLMHYVCAFDEERHLLLWDPVALTNALYLAFGTDAGQAAKANDLKRDVERLGSRARNSRFAARRSLVDASQLEKALSGDNGVALDEATLQQYERMNRRLDEAAERMHRKESELRKAEALVADRSADLTGLQVQYNEVFATRAEASLITRHHPLVRSTLQDDRCAVCAATGVAESVQSVVESGLCPLCKSEVVPGVDDAENIETLKLLDQRIEEARTELEKVLQRRARLKDDYDVSLLDEVAARDARESFLADNPEAERRARLGSESGAVSAEIERLRAQAERFDLRSKREYRERDVARRSLLVIERQLQASFDQHSDRLTELFRTYATAFVGLTVDIELEHRKGLNDTGFELMLSLADQVRARADDVSESQRFFLDIALRMALAECMSPSGAMLLIDTPEGSLDITYEARAGQMFSDFAERGNTLLMTANLRSSALLLRLGERRRQEGMQIERMTDWTELSDVQQAEEGLFDRAYEEISQALL